jgi:hypothetical protein
MRDLLHGFNAELRDVGCIALEHQVRFAFLGCVEAGQCKSATLQLSMFDIITFEPVQHPRNHQHHEAPQS